jgi:peroxiredoxin
MDSVILNHQPAPDFSLPDLGGDLHVLSGLRGKVVIINFWSCECPHAARSDELLLAYLKEWGEQVALLTLAANANEPINHLKEVANQRGLPLVLHDAEHRVADLYGALTTPHLFVIDKEGILRYQGAFDDVTFRQRTPTCFYLQGAVDAVLRGGIPDPDQTPSYGCIIVRFAP